MEITIIPFWCSAPETEKLDPPDADGKRQKAIEKSQLLITVGESTPLLNAENSTTSLFGKRAKDRQRTLQSHANIFAQGNAPDGSTSHLGLRNTDTRSAFQMKQDPSTGCLQIEIPMGLVVHNKEGDEQGKSISEISITSEIISHAEDKFAKIIKLNGLKPEDIMESLIISENMDKVFKAGEGAGESGSFFFFSKDNKLLIKTMSKEERVLMLDMLDDLVEYLEKNNNQSLLARIYGIYTFKTNVFKPMDVLVMQNVAVLRNPKNLSMKFDLKGSLLNRETHFSNNEANWW